MTISEFLKKYRKEHKMSMQTLADRSGVSKGYISMIEGRRNPKNNYKEVVPSILTLKKLAHGMGIDFDELVSMIDDDITLTINDDDISAMSTDANKLIGLLKNNILSDTEVKQLLHFTNFLISQRSD